jgi:arylsulfatase A-like enzyme
MKRMEMAAALGVAIAGGWAASAHEAQPAKPNVVLIVSDDMGYNDTTVYGCKDIKTPNIERLAAAGTVFTDAYVTGPICVPSRMGLFFGRYPQRWGIYGHTDGHVPKGQQATLTQTTLGTLFQRAGYVTAVIGKWHLSGARCDVPVENSPDRNGFDEVSVIHGGMASYAAGTPLYVGKGKEEPAPGFLTDHFGKLAVDFIGRHRAKPFFLALTFTAVHSPFMADRGDIAEKDPAVPPHRHVYNGMMKALDRNVGRVLDALAAAGLEQNTIVAFINDNGGPKRTPACNDPLRGFKVELYEGGIRTPMIMKWPGRIPAGKRFAGISSGMDLGATFLAAAGLSGEAGKPLDGVDLLPFLDGRQRGDPHPVLFWECNWNKNPDCAVRRGRWKAVQLRTQPGNPAPDKWELYDLSGDISESHNVATAHTDIVKELDAAHRAWRAQMVDSVTAAAGPSAVGPARSTP